MGVKACVGGLYYLHFDAVILLKRLASSRYIGLVRGSCSRQFQTASSTCRDGCCHAGALLVLTAAPVRYVKSAESGDH
jgi:hypothetical protein